MKALILAAGLGTRLLPVTETIPKALVRINGTTLLEIAIKKLAREGFNDIIVNVHHHADLVKEFLAGYSFSNVNISISDESDLLLDTGGAILKARRFLDGKEPFLVHNVDVISNIKLKKLWEYHNRKGGTATLSVIDRQTKRYFLFEKNLRLTGWTDASTGEVKWAGKPADHAKKLAFSGIHVISPDFFISLTEKGRFSIVDTYLRLAASHDIYGYIQKNAEWFDLGKTEQLEIVSRYLKKHPENFATP